MSALGSVVLAMFLLQAAVPQPSDKRAWYEAYTDGLRQFQGGQWQAAIASLEAAKAGGPAAGRAVRFYGDVAQDFLPDYYLGLAYNKLERFEDANAAFERVRSSGLIELGDGEHATLLAESARAGFESLMARATRSFERKSFEETQTLLGQARSTGLDKSRVDLFFERLFGAEKAATAGAENNQAASTSTPPPQQQQATPTQEAKAPDVGSNAVRPQAQRAVAARQELPVALPGPEQVALAAYFSGDYRRAEALWSSFTGRRASARADFYLACSRAALVLTGAAEPATLEAARTLFAGVDATRLGEDRRFISPRVLEMLQAGR